MRIRRLLESIMITDQFSSTAKQIIYSNTNTNRKLFDFEKYAAFFVLVCPVALKLSHKKSPLLTLLVK